MEEFKGNSYASKNLEKQKESEERSRKNDIITTKVSVKKQSEISKLKKNFFAEDASMVGQHIVSEVIIPGFQRLVTDIVKNGIDWLIYGSKGTRRNNGVNNVSYYKYYDHYGGVNNGAPSIPISAYKKPSVFSVNDVIFDDRGEAEAVLLRMIECIERYGMVSVADYYDMIGQKCAFTDQKYGWTNLANASVIRCQDGYSIHFPKVGPLE